MRRFALAALLVAFAFGLVGCFEWTEDSQGHLTSVGLPGVPVWQAQPNAATAQPMTPADLPLTPDEKAKFSGQALAGPVMMLPPVPPSKVWGYRYYQTGQNHCEDDLKKIIADRQQNGIAGPAPYCTNNPTSPPPVKGEGFVF